MIDNRPAHFSNTYYDVVALAASAGGLNALTEVLRSLPVDFPAAVLVVQHIEPHRKSMLAEILNRKSPMPVQQAKDGIKMEPGIVYIAPPDHHMQVEQDGRLHLNQDARVNFSRPAIDPLIESMAEVYRERIIVVILTGMGNDGSKGIGAVKARGGEVIVQDLDSSKYTGMPGAAIHTGNIDFVLPLETISSAIVSLVSTGRYQ